MLGSMAFFTINDTLVKLVGETVPLWQIVTVRGVMAGVLLLCLARLWVPCALISRVVTGGWFWRDARPKWL